MADTPGPIAVSAEAIRQQADALGFDACRVTAASTAPHALDFRDWIATGCHADMAWMARTPDRRSDPREVLADCRSVVMLAVNYFPGTHPPAASAPGATGRIARYAWNDDYHDIVLPHLKSLAAWMSGYGGEQKCYVDTGPALERDFADKAGLGWNGKSTVQIHRDFGPWFFLATILTTLHVPADPPARDRCGSCTRCLDACPTQAITRPHHVDSRLCISYLTIEHKGPIPENLRPLIGDRIYGCDTCLDVCPWNRFAQQARESRYHARESIFRHRLRDFLELDDAGFRALFARSPIKRTKRPRFLRNVCVALGNVGTRDDLPALQTAATDPDPLIAEHALWAVAHIQKRDTQ